MEEERLQNGCATGSQDVKKVISGIWSPGTPIFDCNSGQLAEYLQQIGRTRPE